MLKVFTSLYVIVQKEETRWKREVIIQTILIGY